MLRRRIKRSFCGSKRRLEWGSNFFFFAFFRLSYSNVLHKRRKFCSRGVLNWVVNLWILQILPLYFHGMYLIAQLETKICLVYLECFAGPHNSRALFTGKNSDSPFFGFARTIFAWQWMPTSIWKAESRLQIQFRDPLEHTTNWCFAPRNLHWEKQ